jgi:hypothetical protein
MARSAGSEKQIQPEILAQLPKLRVNVISEPVRLKDGWHILKVLDAREPFTPIFDQVRLQLAQRLRAEKTRASMQAYMTEMLQKHPVAVNEVALSKLLHESSARGRGHQTLIILMKRSDLSSSLSRLPLFHVCWRMRWCC